MEGDKAEVARLFRKFSEMSYFGKGLVKEYIMSMIEINARLRDLDVEIKDEQVVHMALESLPITYSNLRTSYNASKSKWNLNKLIYVCVKVAP